MGKDLNGRVVVITGASSGIGAATAVACGRRGMRVGLYARREVKLKRVVREVEAVGVEAIARAGDVRDREALGDFVTHVAREWGRLDVVIANAGFGVLAPVAETAPDVAREIFDVNVLGSVWAIQAAWPIFEVQRSGHVVLVSSIVAKLALPGNGLYSATKAAQESIAEALRVEAEEIDVDVSIVYPIGTETEFLEAQRDAAGTPRARPARPAGPKRQTAEEVAEAIVDCLVSPRFEVYPYRRSRVLPWLDAASPGLASRMLRFPDYYRRQRGGATGRESGRGEIDR